MSKRKIIRRFRAGADEGISIVDDNGETYIHIDLNNETHLSELINMICYNISINGIIDLRNILKSDEFNTLLNNPAKQSISTINEMIQKLSPYSELKNISNIIQLLNSIIQLSSIDTSNKVDEQEIKRQEALQDQPTTTEEQVTNTDKQTTIPQEKENMSDIVDEKEIERQEKLEELAKKEAQIQIDMDNNKIGGKRIVFKRLRKSKKSSKKSSRKSSKNKK